MSKDTKKSKAVDVSSVNKSKKNKNNIGNLFKKQRDPSRDAAGRFTVTGSGGMLSRKSFNWRRILPVVIITALVGGFFVYRSFAASPYSFISDYRNIKGCVGAYTKKISGINYVVSNGGGCLSSELPVGGINIKKQSGIVNPTSQVCTHFRMLSDIATITIMVTNKVGDVAYSKSKKTFVGKNNTFNHCSTRLNGKSYNNDWEVLITVQKGGLIGADTIYGLK